MASTKEYLNFVLEQLSGLDEISSRAMPTAQSAHDFLHSFFLHGLPSRRRTLHSH